MVLTIFMMSLPYRAGGSLLDVIPASAGGIYSPARLPSGLAATAARRMKRGGARHDADIRIAADCHRRTAILYRLSAPARHTSCWRTRHRVARVANIVATDG